MMEGGKVRARLTGSENTQGKAVRVKMQRERENAFRCKQNGLKMSSAQRAEAAFVSLFEGGLLSPFFFAI